MKAKKELLSIMLCMLVLGTSIPSISAIKNNRNSINIKQISTINKIIEEIENRYSDQEKYEPCTFYPILKKLGLLGTIFMLGCILIIRYIQFCTEAWWIRPGYHNIWDIFSIFFIHFIKEYLFLSQKQ